jgi:hypothetical protein
MEKTWCRSKSDGRGDRYSIDVWQGCLAGSRKHLRGWSANRKAEINKIKSTTLSRMENLDKEGERKKDC